MKKINHFLLRVGRRFQLRRVWAYPEIVQLIPTNACNLHCKNCPKTYYATDNRHLHPEVYARVRNDLFKHIKVLNLQGLGEPLLAPLFPKMLEEAEEYGLKVVFVTNATLLDRALIKKLIKIGANVTISLDGANAETHEKARPGSNFSQILDAFALFKEERKVQGNTGFLLHINTVVNRMNVDEIDGIIDIAAKYGINLVNLINPGVGDRTDEFAVAAIGKHPHLLASKIDSLIKKAKLLGIGLLYPVFAAANNQPQDAEHKPESQKSPSKPIHQNKRLFPGRCLDPWNMIYIDVDGWVRPCCRVLWLGMGNILENSFWEIWNNKHYRTLRKHINSNNPPDFCRTCDMNWGINLGDDLYVKKLEEMGITLPKPPIIGVTG